MRKSKMKEVCHCNGIKLTNNNNRQSMEMTMMVMMSNVGSDDYENRLLGTYLTFRLLPQCTVELFLLTQVLWLTCGKD